MTKEYVILRCKDAGCHFGELVSEDDRWVELRDARRVWSWTGANSLSDIATKGAGPDSRIAVTIKRQLIRTSDVCEVLFCEPACVAWFVSVKPWTR